MGEDRVVLVDANGQDCFNADGTLRTAGKIEAHRRGLRHRAISVFVFNGDGNLLLQRRATHKYHSGGLWSNTCCSHPRPGESPADAATRRLWEEMRISCALQEIHWFQYRAAVGNGFVEDEYDHVFTGVHEGPPDPDPAEACGWKWMDCDELRKALRDEPQRYTYWLRYCFDEVIDRTKLPGKER